MVKLPNVNCKITLCFSRKGHIVKKLLLIVTPSRECLIKLRVQKLKSK